ncbi:MAG TPA: ADOP family duplicated permease [Vicinamibacterales bacterium]|nr:ADOP family duplicated permease [Vicinamibacterales bacterium]
MAFWRHLTHGLRVLTRRAAADRDIDDELRHWTEEATAQHVARGLSPDAARRAALAEIGPPTLVRERVRDHAWEEWVASWLTDLRIAARTLWHTPLFTVVVVLVVALGTGAVTTVFSAMNAILLRPLPGVAAPDGLVGLRPQRRDGDTVEQLGYPGYLHLREHARSIDGIAAWGRAPFTIAAGGEGTAVLGNLVTANYFELLGVAPFRGRFFRADEDRTPGTHPVLVVSHAFWQAHLGGDEAAIGRPVSVNGHPFILIGVAPPAFRGLYTGMVFDAWAPVMMQPQLRPRTSMQHGSWLWAFARLHAGVDAAAAGAELSTLMDAHRRSIGEPDTPDALSRMRVTPLTGLPGGSGPATAFLGLLLGAAALVLVIAGVNVAAMLSARYASRSRDLAVRAALGAGRLRLIRQLVTEVLVLFGLGAIGGFVVAAAATSALERLPLPASIPVTLEISPDVRVLAFAIGLALVAGLACGLVPALQGARRDITDRLKAESAGSGRRRSRLGRLLVAGQLALSLVLLVAAGLFVRAMDRGSRVDPGFDRDGVLTTTLEPEAWGYDAAATTAFYAAVRERVAATPGVEAVAYTSRVPLMFGSSVDGITYGTATRQAHYAGVDEGYFDVLRLPIRRGRGIARTDVDGAPRVAVVNETLARILAPDGDALGRTFRFRDADTMIVGIARDAKYASLDEVTPPFFYVPLAQMRDQRRYLLVRGPAAAGSAIAGAVRARDPRLPAPPVSTLADDTRIALFPQRAAAIVTGGLGATALLLAALGLYGTIAASAVRRTREIGIRLALGASRGEVLRTVVGEGAQLALAGIVIGLPLAALTMPLLRQWLFEIDPLDPATYAVLSLLLGMVALAASYLPARRAAAVDPLRALRTD